ncbi:MAG: thioredoxin family protein, partial [bacterium]
MKKTSLLGSKISGFGRIMLVALALALSVWANAGEEGTTVTTVLGKPAPTFSDLPGTDGKTYGLNSFKDKKVVVVFFSCNHCPWVKAWEDRIVETQKDYADKGVAFIAIAPNDDKAIPEDNMENMKKRAAEKKFNFPYVSDESQKIATEYRAEFTPEFYVLDEHRVVRYHGKIDDNRNAVKVEHKYLRAALDAVLAGKAPQTPETRAQGCTIKW